MWHLWQDRQHVSFCLLCPVHAVAPVEKPGGGRESSAGLWFWGFTGTWYQKTPELGSDVMVLFAFLGITHGSLLCFMELLMMERPLRSLSPTANPAPLCSPLKQCPRVPQPRVFLNIEP